MKIYKAFVLCLFFFYGKAFADDEFGIEDAPSRKVVFKEYEFSKKISIFTIYTFQNFDKHILSKGANFYKGATTYNFRLSVRDFFSNLRSGEDLVNSVLIVSPDRFITSLSHFVLNVSLGTLGTFNVAESLNMPKTTTTTVDTLRFYKVPEVYFFTVTVMPLTLTSSSAFMIDSYKNSYSPINLGFFVGMFGLLINERALQPEVFDVLQKLKPEVIYENIKNTTYSEAKYFKIERNLYKPKTRVLKEHYQVSEFLL